MRPLPLLIAAARRLRIMPLLAAVELVRELAGLGASWVAVAAGLAAALTMGGGWMAAASARTSDNTNRINGLVTAAGATNATVATLNQGIFSNVQGNTVQMTAASASTLHCQALAELSDTTNTTFLSSLTQCGPQSTGTSGFGGNVWTSAQQSALLALQSIANSSITSLTNHGFMSS